MFGPILIDLSHTSHTPARTGVQRVALGLWEGLAEVAQPITYDPFARHWRELEAWEKANLAAGAQSGDKRSARWPWMARWRGRLRHATRAVATGELGLTQVSSNPDLDLVQAHGLIVPEIFSAEVGAALPALLAEIDGPKVAVFHDAIALRLPELASPKTVARFPGYLRELAQFDGVAAISEASRAELLGYWDWAGIWDAPPVVAIPLGVERVAPNPLRLPTDFGPARGPAPARAGESPLHLLSVASIEGRKNHLALLEACESLWQRGFKFELRLIGLAQRQTGAAALALIERLQAAGRPLRYDGAASDEVREAAYAEADFTLYPSLAEGFGLPVAESLARGKPCICLASGALGEIARGGGCLTVAEPTAAALAAACARLIEDRQELAALAVAARSRVFPTPAEHARRVLEWMGTVEGRTRTGLRSG